MKKLYNNFLFQRYRSVKRFQSYCIPVVSYAIFSNCPSIYSHCLSVDVDSIQVQDPRVHVVVKSSLTILARLQSGIDYLSDLLAIWMRSLYLFLLFGPSVLTSPLLLLSSEFEYIHSIWWKMTRYVICLSGPCGIKFSQWVSVRPDLFSIYICSQLNDLQANTSCSPKWNNLEPILENHIVKTKNNKSMISIEKDIHNLPVVLGSGCIASVIKGRLNKEKNGNDYSESVAIKMTHPNVKQCIQQDVLILKFITNVLEGLLPGVRQLSLSESVIEFERLMFEQLDMEREASSLLKFRDNFAIDNKKNEKYNLKGILNYFLTPTKDYKVDFPYPFRELTSSDILMETFADGLLLTTILDTLSIEEKKVIARIGLHSFFKMLFIDNFIHADLHPGNIVVTNLNGSVRLTLIDVGLVVVLSAKDRKNFVDLFKAVVMNQGYAVGQLMIERSIKGYEGVIDSPQFCSKIGTLVSKVHASGLTLNKIGVSSLLSDVLQLCYKHQVKLESKYVSVIVALGVLEGLGRQLDPELDVLKVATPYVLSAAALNISEIAK